MMIKRRFGDRIHTGRAIALLVKDLGGCLEYPRFGIGRIVFHGINKKSSKPVTEATGRYESRGIVQQVFMFS
jgi:hypothetical protein